MASNSATLSWAQTAALNPSRPLCLSCGGQLDPALARLASLRCHDCRAAHAPIDPRHLSVLASTRELTVHIADRERGLTEPAAQREPLSGSGELHAR